jgi:hypothetical protein
MPPPHSRPQKAQVFSVGPSVGFFPFVWACRRRDKKVRPAEANMGLNRFLLLFLVAQTSAALSPFLIDWNGTQKRGTAGSCEKQLKPEGGRSGPLTSPASTKHSLLAIHGMDTHPTQTRALGRSRNPNHPPVPLRSASPSSSSSPRSHTPDTRAPPSQDRRHGRAPQR